MTGLELSFTDLSGLADQEKERRTLEAMDRGDALIYSGRIKSGDLLGVPDLLRKEGNDYVAGDIKSGAGEEGGGSGGEDGDEEGDERRPKKHYAVQLALYTNILGKIGRSGARRAFVWDIHGDEVPYEFTVPYGQRNPRTLWQEYEDVLAGTRRIVAREVDTLPAYGGECKNCVWYAYDLERMVASDDLSLIPGLGRPKRDVMMPVVNTKTGLAASQVSDYLDPKNKKKSILPGVGPASLEKFIPRARLLTEKGAKPFLRAPIKLPVAEKELFFDIEVDPLRDVCYLHGFVERVNGPGGERGLSTSLRRHRRRKPRNEPFVRLGRISCRRSRPPSIFTQSTSARDTASFSSCIRTFAARRLSKPYLPLRWQSIFTQTQSSRRPNGLRLTSRL